MSKRQNIEDTLVAYINNATPEQARTFQNITNALVKAKLAGTAAASAPKAPRKTKTVVSIVTPVETAVETAA